LSVADVLAGRTEALSCPGGPELLRKKKDRRRVDKTSSGKEHWMTGWIGHSERPPSARRLNEKGERIDVRHGEFEEVEDAG